MTLTRYVLFRFAAAFGYNRRVIRMGDAASEMHLLKDAESLLGKRIWEKVEEIEDLHGKKHAWKNIDIIPKQNILSYLKSDLFDIDVEFHATNGKEFGFVINGYRVTYDKFENKLKCGDNEAFLNPENGMIRLRILVDRVSTEIYANQGRIYMPMRTLPLGDKKGIEVFSKGGRTRVTSLKVWEMNSIWE